jgi:hypothetical protein
LTASHSSAGIFLGSTTGRGGSEKEKEKRKNPEERERREKDREKEKWRQKKRNEVAQYFVDGRHCCITLFFFLINFVPVLKSIKSGKYLLPLASYSKFHYADGGRLAILFRVSF